MVSILCWCQLCIIGESYSAQKPTVRKCHWAFVERTVYFVHSNENVHPSPAQPKRQNKQTIQHNATIMRSCIECAFTLAENFSRIPYLFFAPVCSGHRNPYISVLKLLALSGTLWARALLSVLATDVSANVFSPDPSNKWCERNFKHLQRLQCLLRLQCYGAWVIRLQS